MLIVLLVLIHLVTMMCSAIMVYASYKRQKTLLIPWYIFVYLNFQISNLTQIFVPKVDSNEDLGLLLLRLHRVHHFPGGQTLFHRDNGLWIVQPAHAVPGMSIHILLVRTNDQLISHL